MIVWVREVGERERGRFIKKRERQEGGGRKEWGSQTRKGSGGDGETRVTRTERKTDEGDNERADRKGKRAGEKKGRGEERRWCQVYGWRSRWQRNRERRISARAAITATGSPALRPAHTCKDIVHTHRHTNTHVQNVPKLEPYIKGGNNKLQSCYLKCSECD